jgi:hypothetical protein
VAINYSQNVYLPTYNVFARPVTFMLISSNPPGTPFDGRGIYSTQPVDVLSEDNSIFSDQQTILDILEQEFTVIPEQGDRLFIPAHIGMPELGNFEIMDADTNGGGETTLVLRKVVVAKP